MLFTGEEIKKMLMPDPDTIRMLTKNATDKYALRDELLTEFEKRIEMFKEALNG